MARPRGIVQFTGTLNGISVYKSKHGWIVRKAGGPDPEKMKKDKKFARTRENGKEFGACGRAAGWVRKALFPQLKESGDFRVVSRLTKVFMEIKNLDVFSVRGKRTVEAGLQTDGGKGLLKGFEFNSDAQVTNLLKTKYTLKTGTGAISIQELVPKKHMNAPKGSTHASFKSIALRIDFNTGKFEVQESIAKRVALDNRSITLLLKPAALSQQSGASLVLLQICFYQELNGKDYRLQNSEYNGMQVVGVMV